eukprot:PLAT12502.26.p1 GENE.PLAT12502.26~~PLAT12502.26.p1  ORF type:complete len:449 (+),score=214.05 PLAT12502.26:65-1411(+)
MGCTSSSDGAASAVSPSGAPADMAVASATRRRLSVDTPETAAAAAAALKSSSASVAPGGSDGPGGARLVRGESRRDERRKRLSMDYEHVPDAAASAAAAREELGKYAPGAGVVFLSDSLPAGGQRAETLPLCWGQRSRPGNDPMKRQKENQDCCVVHDRFCDAASQMFFGVWDGHGPNGAFASRYVREHLPSALVREELSDERTCERVLTRGSVDTNMKLQSSSIDCYVSGSTSVTIFLKGSRLWCCNVGDSRAVLGRMAAGSLAAAALSRDHKPDLPEEEERILSEGGRVFEWGVPRVWLRDVDMPGLAMSRSFGDVAAESVGVFAKPEIRVFDLTVADKFIIMGSDGIWEFIESQEAVEYVAPFLALNDPQAACDALVEEAVRRWNVEEDVVDDITCIVVFLKYPPPSAAGDAAAAASGGGSAAAAAADGAAAAAAAAAAAGGAEG